MNERDVMDREELKKKREKLLDELSRLEQKLDSGDYSDASRSRFKSRKEKKEEELDNINTYLKSSEAGSSGTWGRNERMDRIESRIENLGDEVGNINSILEDENLKEKKQEFEKLLEKNKNLEDDAEQLANKLSESMNMEISDSLGGDFEQRKSDIDDSLQTWKWLTGGSIVLLIVASGIIYWDIATSASSGSLNILSKVALILPISVAVWFTSNNYRRERMLKEEYAFKSTLSRSMDGFRKIV